MSWKSFLVFYALATLIFYFIPFDSAEEAYKEIVKKDIYETDLTNCKLELQNIFDGIEVARDREGKSECFSDQHSYILTPPEAEEQYKEDIGKRVGVGIVITHNKNDETIILNVMKGSDAERVLRPHDVIYGVRGASGAVIIFPKNNEFVKFVKKEAPEPIFIRVRRDGALTKEFKIELKENIYPFVFAKNFKGPQIGYIRVRDFGEGVNEEFENALQLFDANYTEEHPRLIVDLRGNRGGFLKETLEMLYLFAKNKGDLILELRYSHEESKERRSKRRGQFSHFRVVVLIDKESASASEVFSGVLKDWSRDENFVIVGTNSHGKGIGQSETPLPNGFLLRVTSFEFFVGKLGTKIHGVGVSPHYVVEDGRETLFVTATSEDPQFVFACQLLSEYPDKCLEIK